MQQETKYKEFILKQCSNFLKENLSDEQTEIIQNVYQKGFQDAINLLKSKNEIEIKSYI